MCVLAGGGGLQVVLDVQTGAAGEGAWGLFYTNFFIPFTGVPCYKRIPEASQWPDKSAGASLSICLRGMSAGKRPDTENLFSQCANLTDEIPCWSYSTRTGMDKLPRALSRSLYVSPSEVLLLARPPKATSLPAPPVNLNGRAGDIDKMQVSPKRKP